jgi:hypothetical protein
MKGKLQLLFTFLFYLSYNPDEAATSVSSAPTEWKLQLPDVQAPTCTGDFYSLPLLLPTTLKSFSVTKNLQTNSLSSLSKIKHSNPLCFSYHNSFLTRPLRFINLCMCLPSSIFFSSSNFTEPYISHNPLFFSFLATFTLYIFLYHQHVQSNPQASKNQLQ